MTREQYLEKLLREARRWINVPATSEDSISDCCLLEQSIDEALADPTSHIEWTEMGLLYPELVTNIGPTVLSVTSSGPAWKWRVYRPAQEKSGLASTRERAKSDALVAAGVIEE